jgi:hypothetical protein
MTMDHMILTNDSGETDILAREYSEDPDGALAEDGLTDSEGVNLKDLGAAGLAEDSVHTKSKHESACVRNISDTK